MFIVLIDQRVHEMCESPLLYIGLNLHPRVSSHLLHQLQQQKMLQTVPPWDLQQLSLQRQQTMPTVPNSMPNMPLCPNLHILFHWLLPILKIPTVSTRVPGSILSQSAFK